MHQITVAGTMKWKIILFDLFIFSCRFEVRLPDIFQHIHQAWSGIDGRLRAEQFKVFEIQWQEKFNQLFSF